MRSKWIVGRAPGWASPRSKRRAWETLKTLWRSLSRLGKATVWPRVMGSTAGSKALCFCIITATLSGAAWEKPTR